MTFSLRHEVREYEFTALVRELLDQLAPAAPPGEVGVPADERIRFATNPSLGFPRSDVQSVEWREGPEGPPHARVEVNFMGLHGTASPLPLHMVSTVLRDLPEPEGLRVLDFLDLFDHRMVSFLYRAQQKYRHALRFDAEGNDEFTRRVLALGGVDADELRRAIGLPVRHLLRGLGVLASPRRSASGLESLLRACFPEVPVGVRCCVPRRVEIPADQRLYLSPPRQTQPGVGGEMRGLGRDTCIGSSRMDASSAFRVELGPMARAPFQAFLPGEQGYDTLVRLTRAYVHEPHDFDVELRLHPTQRPLMRLAPEQGLRLGQTTWVSPTDDHEGVTRLRAPVAHSQMPTTPAAARAA
jgi:type VI secretion system protein ImpH